MSAVTSVTVPEALTEVAELISAGKVKKAKVAFRKLWRHLGERQFQLVEWVLNVRSHFPQEEARAKVLPVWERCEDAERALIVASMPAKGTVDPLSPTPQLPRQYRRGSGVTIKTKPERRRPRNSRANQHAAATADRYAAERMHVREGDAAPESAEDTRPNYAYAPRAEEDRALLVNTGALTSDIGFRCLGCAIVRARYDLDSARIAAKLGDDGLCRECRERGVTGLPELSPYHTGADAIQSRCEFVWQQAATEFGTVVAMERLRSVWREAHTEAARAEVVNFCEAQQRAEERAEQVAEQPAEEPAPRVAPKPARCATCGKFRVSTGNDDGQCRSCRKLDTEDGTTVTA
jgi:hypothetical protein